MSDKLVTIATYSTITEATLAKITLEAEGIKVFLADTATAQMAWYLSTAVGGIKLQVMESDAEHAISILETDEAAPVVDGQTSPDNAVDGSGPVFDDNYDDLYVSPADKLVKRAFRFAIIGILLPPLLFYSLWLLLRISCYPAPLSSANKRRVLLTFLIDFLVILVFLLIILKSI